jgi:hypothetical protein
MWNKDMNKRPIVQQLENTYPTVSLECPCKYLSQSLQPPALHTNLQHLPITVYFLFMSRTSTPWHKSMVRATCFGCVPKLRQHFSRLLRWTPRFARQWLWRLLPSGIWNRINGSVSFVSENCTTTVERMLTMHRALKRPWVYPKLNGVTSQKNVTIAMKTVLSG